MTTQSMKRPRRVRTLAATIAMLAVATLSTATLRAAPTVVLNGVTVTGVQWPTQTGVNAFLGMRYAASPAGSKRWYPPQPPGAPSSTATQYGNVCPQSGPGAPTGSYITVLATNTHVIPYTFQYANQSEDCLSLNVFVPSSAKSNSKLPVYFWIHGGFLTEGAAASYDPSAMISANNIIVVTINYRLGPLGFLAQSALEPSHNGVVPLGGFMNSADSGNYGLMDQQYALQWVQSHIAAFGGDPTKVTIGGESSGGVSVLSHLASTTTGSGLFRGAIVQSGAFMVRTTPSKASYENGLGNTFVTNTIAAAGSVSACNGVSINSSAAAIFACLQAVPVATLLSQSTSVYGSGGISPDFGTLLLPNGPLTAFNSGEFNKVPVLQGTTFQEGRGTEPFSVPLAASIPTLVAAGGPANYDLTHNNTWCGGGGPCTYLQEINAFLTTLGVPSSFNTSAFDNGLQTLYPLSDYPDPYLANNAPSSDEALAQIHGDYFFICNALDANNALSQYVPVFAYEFKDPLAPPVAAFGNPPLTQSPNNVWGFPSAAEHAGELQFLFNFYTPLSSTETTLGSRMKTYWANFVKNLSPTASSMPWPAFGSAGSVQLLNSGSVPAPFANFSSEHFCPTWEPVISAQ